MGFKVVPANKTVNRKWLHKNGVDFREWARQNKEEFAERMKAEPTPAEQRLGEVLLPRFGGYEWEAQKIVNGFIPDFFCESLKLVVEVDGRHHYKTEQNKKDRHRTYILGKYGITVIRFRNETVLNNIDGVLRKIKSAIGKREKTTRLLAMKN